MAARSETTDGKSIDKKPDLNDLMNGIAAKISDQWRQVGPGLGLSDARLKSINMMYKTQPLECWREVLHKWKTNADDDQYKYRLSTILDALKSVGEVGVARGYFAAIGEVKSKYPKATKTISNSDLRDLLSMIGYKVQDSWRPIGSELGLSMADLKAIEQKELNAISSITEVFSKWTRSLSKEPVNWQTLLDTLCMPQVGLKDVADEVYEKKFTH